MRSRVIELATTPWDPEALRAAAGPESSSPDLVLAFLASGDVVPRNLEVLAGAWPGSFRLGCESLGQFRGSLATAAGVLLLLWFERPTTRVWTQVVRTEDGVLAPSVLDRLAPRLVRSDAALLLADGLGFPIEQMLDRVAERFDPSLLPVLAGALASQDPDSPEVRSRVFRGLEVLDRACLAVGFVGVDARVEVVREWEPASPIYTATRAAGRFLHEIDGERAVDWFARFFTVDGELAPMPEAAWRFPLIVEGPVPRRQGLYRALRGFDDPPGSVSLWGDVRTGDRVRLGIRTGAGARPGDGAVPVTGRPADEVAILFDCVGRHAALCADGESRVPAVDLSPTTVGMQSFGEIAPVPAGGLAYSNLTVVVLRWTEAEELE